MDNFRAVEKEEQGAKKKLKLKEEAPPVTDCSLGDWMQRFNCDYLLPPQKLKPFSAMDKYETFNFITDLIQYVILGDDLKYSHCLYWYSRKNIDPTDIMFQRHQSKFKITKRNLKEQQEEETPPVTECSLSDWMESFDCSYLPLPQKPKLFSEMTDAEIQNFIKRRIQYQILCNRLKDNYRLYWCRKNNVDPMEMSIHSWKYKFIFVIANGSILIKKFHSYMFVFILSKGAQAFTKYHNISLV